MSIDDDGFEAVAPAQTNAAGLEESEARPLRLLVCGQDDENAPAARAYAAQVGRVLEAEKIAYQLGAQAPARGGDDANAHEYDLFFFSEPKRSLAERLLVAPGCRRLLEKSTTPFWFVRQPRWPIRRILLIIRGQKRDLQAERWALRLATSMKAALIVQVISPALPGLYSAGSRVQVELGLLLASDAPVGRQLRRILTQCQKAGIEGFLEQRIGHPNDQIKREVAHSDPDLIILSADEGGRLWRWWMGEVVAPLLRWVDRPVLIAV